MAFKSNSRQWLTTEGQTLKRAEKSMAQVIVNRAKMLAPVLTGALRQSGRVEQSKGKTTAIFGGKSVSVPYARRRHYENRKNPQTLRYLERAGNATAKEGVAKYINMSR